LSATYDSHKREDEKNFLIQVPASSFEYRPRPAHEFDWFFIMLLIFLLLLACIKTKFLNTSRMFYKTLLQKKNNKNKYNQVPAYPYFLFFPFVLCSWIIFSLALNIFICRSIDQNHNVILLWSLIFTLIFFIIRFFLFEFVVALFDMKNIIAEFKYKTKMINFYVACLSFPFLVLINYYSISLLWVIVIFVLFSLYRIQTGWALLKEEFQVYEYFLYFCTIEILPLLVFLKFISNELLLVF
jgi:hypothetical protein